MKNILFFVLISLSLTACAAQKKAAEGGYFTQSIAGMEVAVWLPEDTAPKPYPVLIFSHGFTGCNTQSTYLMKAFATEGYAVFAPNHKDAFCTGKRTDVKPELPFDAPDQWTEATYQARGQDITRLLNALERDVTYSNKTKFDWEHIGLVGHSLGGYTVMGVAGAWPSWKDKRIKEERIQAVLALSPYTEPFLLNDTLHYMHAPVMYQGGTVDKPLTPVISRKGGVYDKTPAPKHYVELTGAGHFAWSDMGRNQFEPYVTRYSLAFLNHYLKRRPMPMGLEAPQAGIFDYREIGD